MSRVYASLALALALCLTPAGVVMAADAAALVKEGDALFVQRADLAKARQAAEAYQAAMSADPANPEPAWKLARVQYWLGKHARGDDAKIAEFEKGIKAAKKALALDPNSIGGHYWLGVSYGLYGSAKGVTKSLSLIDPIKDEMAKVIALNPAYDSGGAYRVLGRLYYKVPGIFGGSNSKAIENLKKAISYGPRRWLNHLYLAEVYIDDGYNDKAKKELKAVIAGPPEPGMQPEWNEEKVQAKKLLDKLD